MRLYLTVDARHTLQTPTRYQYSYYNTFLRQDWGFSTVHSRQDLYQTLSIHTAMTGKQATLVHHCKISFLSDLQIRHT